MKKNTIVGITFDATMNIKDATNSIEEMGRHFETLRKQMPQGLSKRFKSDLEELEAEMKSFKDISSDLETIGDVSALKNSSEKIAKLYKKIKEESSEIADLDLDSLMPKEILEKLASASKLTKAYKKDINALSDETEDYKKKIQDLINLKKEHQELARKKTAIGKTSVSDEDLVAAEQQKIKLGRDVDNAKLKSSGVDLSGKEFQTLLKQQREAVSAYADLQDKARQYKKALSEVENELENNEKAQKKYQEVSEEFGTTLKALEKSLSNLGEDLKIEKFNKFKEELEEITDLDLSGLKQDLSNLEEILGSLSAEQIEKISLAVEGLTENTKKLDKPLGAMKEGVVGVVKETEKIATLSDEVDRLKNQVIDFFSIGNAIELFKRAISSAFETVKELDKTMTETAVVTDFTVGDMWKQLPLYSKNARDLGVSINAAYEATTLYYQQGLKTEEAMGVSNETLRMARIANIDAKDATDLMTAALRGFNMEVNAMNAQKVNDVFSQLAAVTAADTEEIGIAMSKTASIAESANMKFNTTAALLTQIIETTREAPETAGTAMKTIIARFTEVKKLMTAGQLTGTDEEGEVIDVNKIDTALKTVGLSLKGFMQGTEGIDDIFLKLAEKWDGLDISTQRYIATMAAGSRQQSRFLAMMGDYGRTMELVDAANTSAGASQEQFNKTLESMDSKLNKMKVAWDTFVMGIANNEIIKFFVDLLTGLLNSINGIINALSFDNGLIKSVLSLTAAILGLKVGFSIFNKLFDAIKESKGEHVLKTLIANLRKTKVEAAAAAPATDKFSLSLIKNRLASTGATIATKVFGKTALSTAAQVGIALGAIGLLIGAVTLLVFWITKLYQKMREKTPEGKLEAAKKDAEAAAEAAQEAADAYDNLNNSLTSLEDKYADINKLTEGTREWTRSVQELNSEVLDLVDEYPKLARLVENKGGVLTLDIASKDVQNIIDEYEKEKKKTSITETATSGIEKKAQRDVEQKDLLKKIHKSSKYSLSDELIEVVADQIARGELIGEEIDKFFSDRRMNHVSEEAIAGMREYGESVLQEQTESSDYFSNLVLQLESLDFMSQLDAESIRFNKDTVKNEASEGAKKLKNILLDSGVTDKIINDNGGWESFVGQLYKAEAEVIRLKAAREEKALKNLPKSFKELEKLASQDIEVIENLGSQISVMGETAGEDYLESFNEVLRGAKDPEALASYLSTIDPTNMNEITAAMEYMRTQGVDSSQIENFWNKITDGAGTYIDSLESILRLIDKWNKEQLNAEGIGSRLKEGKASTEDMLELTKAGVDLTDFKMTPEGWVGTEEAIRKATDALQDYYDLDQKRVLEQQKEQAAKNAGNRYDGILKRGDSFEVASTVGLGAKTAGGDALTTVDETTGKLVAGQVDMGVSKAVRGALAAAGITEAEKSLEETEDQFLNRLQVAYDSYISLLNNKEDINIMIAKFEEMKAEQEKIDQMKLSSAENISKGASKEIILGSLEREIGEEGFNTDEVKAYAKELTKANEKLGNTSEALDEVSALQSAFASTKSQKGLKEIVDSYDDWNSILDETTGLLEDMSPEGVSTFNKLKASVNEMLNTSVDLSDEFWNNSENIKLIRDAANGSIEALSQLRQIATDEFLVKIESEFESEDTLAEIEQFRVFLATYKLPDLEAGAVLNDGPFIKALNNMITQTRLTTDQVQALITQMGFTAKIDLVQKYVPGYVIETSSARDTLGEGFYDANRIRTIKKTIPGYTYSTPQVKISSMTKNASPYRPSSGGGGGSGGGSKGRSSGGGGGSGGSSSKPKKDTWENPYDDLYNLSEKVNKTIRDRNSLEREYDMILEDRTSSINELLANSLKQLANLRKEKALQGDILKTYQDRLKSAASQEYLGTKTVDGEEEQFWTTFQREATRLGLGSLSSYASVNSETGEIAIDYSKIEAIENNTTSGEAQGALLTAFIGFLEETANSFIDTKETLFDISDQIDEIEKRGKEEYVEFEQSIYDAIVEREQAIIDEYQSLSEVISDSNSKILDSLQESISLERQIRDNTDTEENISDMESRLAYLRRDTSGANDAEIRQLEKDLSDARETYSDTLVDQELQRLSDVNEKAAEQRERQIELMQSQLDYAASNGAFWEEVSRMLESSINADGTLKTTSELVDLLKVTDEFKALSYFGGKVWIDDLIQAWLVALEGKANLEEEYKTTPATTAPTTTTPTTTKPTTTTPTTTTPTTSAPVQEVYTVKSGDTLSGIASAYNKKGFNTTYQKIGKDNAITNLNRIYAGQKLTIKKYKEGGLVDYTGPAWVDGTPGKPEAMLRAVDTQNFIELKEILADILKNPSKGSSKPSGDNYFDVDINVDSIANDYDVEKMASKVKEIINTDARYRNVNLINFLR